jgi:hypothetical protein
MPRRRVWDSGGSGKSSRRSTLTELTTLSLDTNLILTPVYLADSVAPFLSAIESVQQVVNEVKGVRKTFFRIRTITQSSPLNIGLEGATEAVKLLRELASPWRNRHAQNMAELAEREKEAEIALKQAELFEIKARTIREKEEARKYSFEADKQRLEAERLRLDYEEKRLVLERERIRLVFEIVDRLNPDLESEQKCYILHNFYRQ